jgi:hypothetical protein
LAQEVGDQALLQHHLLPPHTQPGYDWLEVDICTRLARGYLATGRAAEADARFRAVPAVRDAHADRALPYPATLTAPRGPVVPSGPKAGSGSGSG